jgi:hypothetical protein
MQVCGLRPRCALRLAIGGAGRAVAETDRPPALVLRNGGYAQAPPQRRSQPRICLPRGVTAKSDRALVSTNTASLDWQPSGARLDPDFADAIAAHALTGLDVAGEPELIVWGHRLSETAAHPLPELKAALNMLEGTAGQQTEPDIILRIPSRGWILSRPNSQAPPRRTRAARRSLGRGRRGTPRRISSTRKHSPPPTPTPSRSNSSATSQSRVQSHSLGGHIVVIALVREVCEAKVSGWPCSYIADNRHPYGYMGAALRPH